MSLEFSKRRISSVLLFLFLSSCNPCNHWSCTKIRGNCQTNSRISSVCSNSNGIEIEIINGKEGLRVYLNSHSLPFSCFEGNPALTEITVTINEKKEKFMAYRFVGGQRLLLTVEAADTILDALYDNQTVTVSAGIFSSEFVGDNLIPCMMKG